MAALSDKAAKVLGILIDIVGEHSRGEREGVSVWTEELNARMGGPARVPFRDEDAFRECTRWCADNDLPLLTMMISADERGQFPDQISCKLAFERGAIPSRLKMKEAWLAEQGEISAMSADDVERAEEALRTSVETSNASKEPKSRRALANARNQEVETKSLDEWLDRYRREVLDLLVPGEPLVRNRFMMRQEGYKDERWDAWQEALAMESWDESTIGDGSICKAIQSSLDDGQANWITKRFGKFNLKERLAEREHGIERFERSAYGFYSGDATAKGFFDDCVELLGRQYSAVSHLMFLKDKQAYVPVKPDSFEAGLRKLGIEFYLSGFCSWDNYTKFLGYLERIHAMLQEVEPETTLLDAHSILWIIGSGYWFEGEGARKLELVRKGELPVDDFI